jgi:hypothetical protein
VECAHSQGARGLAYSVEVSKTGRYWNQQSLVQANKRMIEGHFRRCRVQPHAVLDEQGFASCDVQATAASSSPITSSFVTDFIPQWCRGIMRCLSQWGEGKTIGRSGESLSPAPHSRPHDGNQGQHQNTVGQDIELGHLPLLHGLIHGRSLKELVARPVNDNRPKEGSVGGLRAT